MKTKIVYVLTSTENDVYLEQTLVSIYSLRLHNPDAYVILVVDHDTASSLTGARSEIKKYITELIEVDTPEGFNNMKKSRFLKTNLRSIVSGDYLFIDGDTVIAKPLDDIDKIDGDICAVADKHVTLMNHQSKKYVITQLSKIGVNIKEDDFYVNSGVMLVRDTEIARTLYAEWYKKWLQNIEIGINTDQPPLAYADAKCGNVIKLIDGAWNCQVNENGVRFLHDAYIIHYFASNTGKNTDGPYLLMKHSIFASMKESGEISSEVKDIIKSPLSAFTSVCPIINSKTASFVHTDIYILYISNQKIFGILNYISKMVFQFLLKTQSIRHPNNKK